MNTVVNHWLQVNYVNTLLYPFSARNCPRPGHGLLCILIDDITSKSSLLLFTLLRVIKPHFEKCLLLVTVLISHKKYTDGYWLFYSPCCEGELSILILLQILWYWTIKGKFSAMVCSIIMIIIYFICRFLIHILLSIFRKKWNHWYVVIFMIIFRRSQRIT